MFDTSDACTQTGAGTGLQCGDEFDLFLSPVDPDIYYKYPVNELPSAPLSQLSNLTMSFGANVCE